MPVIYREDGSAAWGMIAAMLAALVVVLGLGFFIWTQSQPVAAVDRGHTTIIQPPAPQPQVAPTVVPVPVPGAAGPAGPAGAPGASGATGPAGAPAPPADPAAPATGGQ